MVVGSTTVKPGEMGTIMVSVIMHEGMGGPHLFHIFVKSSDPQKPVTVLKVKSDIVPLETWKRSHPKAFYLPRNLAEFELKSEGVGTETIPPSIKAFGYPGQLKYGYLGSYEKLKKAILLMILEYTNEKEANINFPKILEKMKWSKGESGELLKKEMAGITIYYIGKGAKDHFYFQRANRVLLLFPDRSVAMKSLEEVLKHIQSL